MENKGAGEDPVQLPADIASAWTGDPVNLYFREIIQEPLLTAEEEIALAKRIKAGKAACEALENSPTMSPRQRAEQEAVTCDAEAARDHLTRANTRLVVSIANRYIGQGLPFLDLIQEGNLGLMVAVGKYDYTLGHRFSSYAWWWIRQRITRSLRQKVRTIRIPLHVMERIQLMHKTASALEQESGRRPTAEELAAQLKLSPARVRSLIEYSKYSIALERPVGDEGDRELGGFIEDTDTLQPPVAADHRLLQEAIEEVLAELTPRQARILTLRFGLNGVGEQHTLEMIAGKFGLSRERIRQLEQSALAILRHSRFADRLRPYLE